MDEVVKHAQELRDLLGIMKQSSVPAAEVLHQHGAAVVGLSKQLKTTIEKQNGHASTLEKATAAAEKQEKEYTQKVADFGKPSKEELYGQITTLKETVKKAESAKNNAESEKQVAVEAKDAAMKKVETANAAKHEAEKATATAKGELTQAMSDMNAVKGEKDAALKAQVKAEEQMKTAVATKDTAVKEKNDAVAATALAKTEKESAQTQIAELKAELNRMQQDRDNLKRQVETPAASSQSISTEQLDALLGSYLGPKPPSPPSTSLAGDVATVKLTLSNAMSQSQRRHPHRHNQAPADLLHSRPSSRDQDLQQGQSKFPKLVGDNGAGGQTLVPFAPSGGSFFDSTDAPFRYPDIPMGEATTFVSGGSSGGVHGPLLPSPFQISTGYGHGRGLTLNPANPVNPIQYGSTQAPYVNLTGVTAAPGASYPMPINPFSTTTQALANPAPATTQATTNPPLAVNISSSGLIINSVLDAPVTELLTSIDNKNKRTRYLKNVSETPANKDLPGCFCVLEKDKRTKDQFPQNRQSRCKECVKKNRQCVILRDMDTALLMEPTPEQRAKQQAVDNGTA